MVVDLADGRGEGADDRPAGGQGVLVTMQRARRRDLEELLEDTPADGEVAAMARRIARSLTVRRRPRVASSGRGAGRLQPMPYRYRSDDIDIDRTLEVLAERPHPEDTEIVVRERVRSPRAVVLVADVSGSMRGEKARITAAAVAALTADLTGAGTDDQLALVAFWSDAALVKSFDARMPAARMLDRLLRIPARGLTNVSFGLEVARAELARTPVRRRSIVLLSDAVHNAGPDPRIAAARCGELHVMLESDGEHDADLAVDLARLGRGRLAPVATHRDVAPALNHLLID
ncbi:vWA domain-containing protein [Pseudonocardia sp. D17]|uniref:vWA domain-containing protein n=1 Tax=Pseudonocardia sp. D17 TaxID=882661 RepID=UPI002B3CDC75|nr:hypothetical protein PSD17_00870 [Pseudonocardia sp. D17]